MSHARNGWQKGVPSGCPLTRGEYKAVKGVADGLTYQQIALRDGVAGTTVRTQLHSAYRRLGVAGGLQAVVYCFKAGWLDPALEREPPPPARRENRVTAAQALYLEAFQRWLRTQAPKDKEEAVVLLRIVRRQGAERATATLEAKAA